MRVGEVEGDPDGDGRRTLANGWGSRLWRLEDKHLREGSSVRQFGRPRPLRIRHRRRRRGQIWDDPWSEHDSRLNRSVLNKLMKSLTKPVSGK